MNVKTTIMLPEHYLRYAEKMVEEGVFPSVSSVIEASLALMMRDGGAKTISTKARQRFIFY